MKTLKNPLSHPLAGAALFAAMLMAGEVRSFATVYLSENWSSYSDGDTPTTPWVLTGTGGTTSVTGFTAPSFVKVEDLSGNKVVQIENAATDEPSGSNPMLRANFSNLTDSDLQISFTYNLAALQNTGGGTGTHPMFQTWDSSSRAGIYLALGGSVSSFKLGFVNSSGTIIDLGNTVSQTEWITITLSDINYTTHTYDIAWSSTDGGSGSYSNASFRNSAASDLNNMRFVDNVTYSQDEGTRLYVDNILVQTVPEPTTALLSLAAFVGMACMRRGRRAAPSDSSNE